MIAGDGTTWAEEPTPTAVDFASVAVAPDATVFAVADSGAIQVRQ